MDQVEELIQYMRELSEKAYCASWMSGLEFALWEAALKGRLKYGRLQLTNTHADRLKELSVRCGGWIVWDESRGATFIPLDRWKSLYATHPEGSAKT